MPLCLAWRFGPTTPSPGAVERAIWEHTLSRFVVRDNRTDRPIGVVLAHHANLSQGFAYLAAGMIPPVHGTGIGVEAIDLFVRHLFAVFPLRKLYVEVPDYACMSIGKATQRGWHEEGRLREHAYWANRWWDLRILSLCRSQYESATDARHPASGLGKVANDAGPAPHARATPVPWGGLKRLTNLYVGRFAELGAVLPERLDFLYRLAVDERIGHRWRFAGAVPSEQEFVSNLWEDVLSQFVVLNRKTGEPLGLVVSYHGDLHAGHAYLAGVMVPEVHRRAIALEGFGLFVNYLFSTFNLRKLYMEFPDYNASQYPRALSLNVTEEACLMEHVFFGGRYWNKRIFAVYRDDHFCASVVDQPVEWESR